MNIDVILLDTFGNDVESILQVKHQFDYLQVPISYETLCEHLAKLVREGYLYIAQSISSDANDWWYGKTKKGKIYWKENIDEELKGYDFKKLDDAWQEKVPYLFYQTNDMSLEEIIDAYIESHPGTEKKFGRQPKQ